MGEIEPALGLRDRKKIKTRITVQREAMRLVEANGYVETTVEQIAAAAEIAPSTFFRYFPNKESVFVTDDLDQVTIETLAAQPADMPSLAAFRHAIKVTLTTLSADEWQLARARLRMVLSIPELKAALFEQYQNTIAELIDTECARLGRDADDLEVRMFVGGLAGALMATLDKPAEVSTRMLAALDFIEAGMPLT